MSDDDSPSDETSPNTPSQIPLLNDIVAEGKPVRRQRRKSKENLSLDLDPEPPVIRDLFDEVPPSPAVESTHPIATASPTPEPETEPPADAGPAPTTEEALRARADAMVDRLVHEYARDMVQRLRSELTQLLDELESPDPAVAVSSDPASPVTPPAVDDWQPWLPVEIWQRLAGVPVNWAIAGGWALDLFQGAQTRDHSDVEIEIPRREWPLVLSALGDCRIFSAVDGVVTALSSPLDVPAQVRQLWIADASLDAWRLDVMLAEGDAQEWVFKRDPSIRAPRTSVTLYRNRIPYLAPEVVLLFKAKATREKDLLDFERCLPRLDASRREWLRAMIRHVHPGHPWLQALSVD